MNCFGQSLRGFSTGINNGQTLDESDEKSIYEIIIKLKNEMNKGFSNVKTDMDLKRKLKYQ